MPSLEQFLRYFELDQQFDIFSQQGVRSASPFAGVLEEEAESLLRDCGLKRGVINEIMKALRDPTLACWLDMVKK